MDFAEPLMQPGRSGGQGLIQDEDQIMATPLPEDSEAASKADWRKGKEAHEPAQNQLAF